MRISQQVLRIAEDRVTWLTRALEDCHPDDKREIDRLQERLNYARGQLRDKHKMVARENSYR